MRTLTVGEFYLVSTIVAILNCADALTTIIGLSIGASELNPLISNNLFMLIFKLFSVSMFIVTLNYIYGTRNQKIYKQGCTIPLVIMGTGFLGAVINNIIVIMMVVK